MVLRRRRTHHSEPGTPASLAEARPETYRRWRRTTLGAITQARELEVVFDLAGSVKDRRLLDVGCGDGIYSVEVARRGAVTAGIDRSEAMLAAAHNRAADAGLGVDLQLGDARALPFDDESFDIVIAVTVLCFLPDPQEAINEMSRVLAPGGRLVIGELGKWSTWAAWRRLRGWLGSTTWRNVSFRNARRLTGFTDHAGLETATTRGAVYYPPLALLAGAIAPIEERLSCVTTLGAAFVAVSARKPLR
jgi:SAM-dependent methyltransferase